MKTTLGCVLLAGLAMNGCGVSPQDSSLDPYAADTVDETGEVSEAVSCSPQLSVYPVRGRHNNGYDSTAGNSSQWTCDDAHSNSDFGGDHIGNDIWAARGTPVAATSDGRLVLTGWSDYSGNKVTLIDGCGWYHFYCHLDHLAPGIANGAHVKAGQIVGYVGNTGTASNGVVHLHYSVYPAGNYNAGIDPWPKLHAVESNTCGPANQPPPTEEISNGGSAVYVDGTYHVFARDSHGALRQKYWSAGAGWSGWQDLGGVILGTPAVTHHDHRYDVFAVGQNGQLYQKVYTDSWSGWINLGGDYITGVDAVYANGQYHVFVVTQSGTLFQKTWLPGSGWTGFQNLGGVVVGAPAVTFHDGRYDVFAVGINGSMYQKTYDGHWGEWHGLGGDNLTGLGAVYTPSGQYHVFGITTNGTLFQKTWFPASGWTSWQNLTGVVEGKPTVTFHDGRYDVFAFNHADTLYQKVYTPTSSWSGWINLGGIP